MTPPPQRPETYASLPGNADVQWLVWARCFPGRVALPAIALLLVLILLACTLIFAGTKGLVPAAALVLVTYRLWQRLDRAHAGIKRQFRSGCVNPAQVVGRDLIAVYTDLGNGSDSSGPWPVVKILRQPLHRAPGKPLRVGDRLAAVALYQGSMKKPHWDDFFPVAINCVTADEVTRQRLMAELNDDPEEWKNLERYLTQVQTQTRPGLYHMRQA